MKQQTIRKVLNSAAPWQDADDCLYLIREGETLLSSGQTGITRNRLLLILGEMAPVSEVMLTSPDYWGQHIR